MHDHEFGHESPDREDLAEGRPLDDTPSPDEAGADAVGDGDAAEATTPEAVASPQHVAPRLRIDRQTGIKVAVVVSFVVFVGVVILNKVRGRAKTADATQLAEADPESKTKDKSEKTTTSKNGKGPKTLNLSTLPKEDKDDVHPPADPSPGEVVAAPMKKGDDIPDISDLPPDPNRKASPSQVVTVSPDDENTPPDSDLPELGGGRRTATPGAEERTVASTRAEERTVASPRAEERTVASPQVAESPAADPRPDPAASQAEEPTSEEKAEGKSHSDVASTELAALPDLMGTNPAAESTTPASTDVEVAATKGTAPEEIPVTPRPSGNIPSLESPPPVVATPSEMAPRPAEPQGEKEWIRLPNARRKKEAAAEPVGELSATPGPSKSAPGPAPDPEAEVVLHTVRAGEDFATLARYYYNSTRFRRALWEANRKRVPSIDDLPPGTTIRVPMPEALDPSLIPPAGEEVATEPARPAASKPKSIARRDSQARRTSRPQDDLVPMEEESARRPTYVVRQGQTLRSIARDTMDDPHRDGEILELNRDVIEDPRGRLPQGLRLALPDDARTGRKVR